MYFAGHYAVQGLKTERVTLKVRRAVTRHRTSSEGSSSSSITDVVSVTPVASDMELSQEEGEGKSDDEVK